MSATIAPAFPSWAPLNRGLVGAIAPLTEGQLARTAGEGRWPLWAVIGHLACQRVFWLCDFAGEVRKPDSLFPRAAWECPGDEDLMNVLSAVQLVDALEQSFEIVERALNAWTFASLSEEIQRSDWDDSWTHTRGFVIDRVHSHDLWHAAEASEILTAAGLAPVIPWT